MSVTIGALRESAPRETRVCLVPEVADKLTREGARVLIERGAGVRACFPDSLYKGVTWADSAAGVLAAADVILTVQPLTVEQIGQLKPGAVVVGDRKSTRLNSSHLVISYAVFCLKKQNKHAPHDSSTGQ